MRDFVYIIGPYTACDGLSEQHHVTRAVALGALALREGRVPLIPHLTVGCPSLVLDWFGVGDADALARQASYGEGGGLAGLVRSTRPIVGTDVWAILRQDGSMSTGTRAEHEVVTSDPLGHPAVALRWPEWRPRFEAAGIGHIHDELSKPITGFLRWPRDHGPTITLNLPTRA